MASTEKVKLLLNKKPVAASKKTISDALEGSEATGEIEFGVMVMGGAPDPPPQAEESIAATAAASTAAPMDEKQTAEATPMEGVETSKNEPLQPGEISGQAVVEKSGFWDDLQGFLEQRVRSSEEAAKLRGVFEKAWRSSTAAP